jgi:hypothetical protein
MLDNEKLASISKILIDEKQKQIDAIIEESPYEAMAMATRLYEDYESDESLALCVWTALKASVQGEHVMTQELCSAAQDVSRKRLFNPESVILGVAAKLMVGQTIEGEDMAALDRASKMDTRITKEILGLAISLADQDQMKLLEKYA